MQSFRAKPEASASVAHKALVFFTVLLFIALLFQLGLDVYYGTDSTTLNEGIILVFWGGNLFTSFSFSAVVAVSAVFASATEWLALLHGLLSLSLGLLYYQFPLAFHMAYPSGHLIRDTYCHNLFNPEKTFCNILDVQGALTLAMCAIGAIVGLLLFIRIRAINRVAHRSRPSIDESEFFEDVELPLVQHHNVNSKVFVVLKVFTFLTFVGMSLRLASSIKETIDDTFGFMSVSVANNCIYIAAISVALSTIVANQRGHFSFLCVGGLLATGSYLSTIVYGFRKLTDSSLGDKCDGSLSEQCTILTVALAGDCVVAGSQVLLALMGFYHLWVGSDLYALEESSESSPESPSHHLVSDGRNSSVFKRYSQSSAASDRVRVQDKRGWM